MIDVDFIKEWQELIGAALGPFLAIILSAIGFWIKSIIEDKKERKEFLRRIEISLARSLNDIFTAREQLRWFSGRVKNLAAESKSITDDKIFFLNRVNFPTVREIYRDVDMPNFKIKSYYLHNKLMWIDAGTKEMNEVVQNLKNDFADLIRQNEILVAVMRNNPNPKMQRMAYEQNLESYASAISDFTSKSMKQGIEIMTQVKIYNEKLRRRNGHIFLWKQEGTKFKFFRNKKEQKAFSRNLDSLDRIDKVIQKEVEVAIKNAEDRAKKLVHT